MSGARELEGKVITHWKGKPLPELPEGVEWFQYASEPAVREIGAQTPTDVVSVSFWPDKGRRGLIYAIVPSVGRKCASAYASDITGGPELEALNLATDEEALNILAQWFWMGVA